MSPSDQAIPQLAACAVSDGDLRGRAHPEDQPSAPESPFETDYARIVHCTAFRRLMHKTQVFVTEGGDHFRTRLTHTLEVAVHARRLARRLQLNEPLTVAVAMAHDLGHPPFGHAGETALAELMAGAGGFEHNLQSLRVVDYLEHPYPAWRGLNLSFEVRESLLKHRLPPREAIGYPGLEAARREFLSVGVQPPLEGQVADLADGIAYTLHDIEDGLVECGLSEAELGRTDLWKTIAGKVREHHNSLSIHAVRRPILDALARFLLDDTAEATRGRLARLCLRDADAVRRHDTPLVDFSDEVKSQLTELQQLLRKAVYADQRVVRMDIKARRLVREVFEAYMAEPTLLPSRFRSRIDEQGPHRVIADYIAGMTDRFCQQEHRRLFDAFHFG